MAMTPAELTAEPPAAPSAHGSRRLKPVLGVTAATLLTVSCITPASSLFIIVLLRSAPVDLAITGGIVVVALAYEVLYLRPRRDTRFLVDAREDR